MLIKPKEGGFGATVEELESTVRLSKPSIYLIKNAIKEFKVIEFSPQIFSAAQLEIFARQFGNFAFDPFLESRDMETHVVEVRRSANETTPIFGSDWHSDWSFLSKPPCFTFLYGENVPPVGGQTVFADCVHAYRLLPDSLKEAVENMIGAHSARRAYGIRGLFSKDDSTRSMRIKTSVEAESVVYHPVVRSVNAPGGKALFVNPVYTLGVEGLHKKESDSMLENLYRFLIKRSKKLVIEWKRGTLVMWDNRCVIHHAMGGYEGYDRLMFRVTIGEERPVKLNG